MEILNVIYEMADIIKRVEKTNEDLMKMDGSRRTLVMSQISSGSVSLNAVPAECEVYLDRRMVVGETEESIKKEMDQIINGKNATWEIELTHPLAKTCIAAYTATFGVAPEKFDYWDFSTNAVTTVGMGIPTIGFGPGEYKLAHMINEKCEVSQIVDA